MASVPQVRARATFQSCPPLWLVLRRHVKYSMCSPLFVVARIGVMGIFAPHDRIWRLHALFVPWHVARASRDAHAISESHTTHDAHASMLFMLSVPMHAAQATHTVSTGGLHLHAHATYTHSVYMCMERIQSLQVFVTMATTTGRQCTRALHSRAAHVPAHQISTQSFNHAHPYILV